MVKNAPANLKGIRLAPTPQQQPQAYTVTHQDQPRMVTINTSQIPSLIISWLKWFGNIALLVVAAGMLARGLGFPLPYLASIGWQEGGIFLAGTAYALR